MYPKIKVLLAFIVCIVATPAILFVVTEYGLRHWSRPTGHGSQGGWVIFLFVVPIVVFLTGAILTRPMVRAATKSPVTATFITLAFATFPIWFVPMAFRAFFAGYATLHPPPPPPPPAVDFHLLDATSTDTPDGATLQIRVRAVVQDSISKFQIDVDGVGTDGSWSVDEKSTHDGHITAVREPDGFHYEETTTQQPLLEGPGRSVIIPLTLKRWKKGARLPASMLFITFLNPPADRYRAGNVKQVLYMPWAQPSDRL